MKAIRRVDGLSPLPIPPVPPAWWPEAPAMRRAFRQLHAQSELPGASDGIGSHLEPAPQALIVAALHELPPRMAWELPEGVVRFLTILRERNLERSTFKRIPDSFEDRVQHVQGLLVVALLR